MKEIDMKSAIATLVALCALSAPVMADGYGLQLQQCAPQVQQFQYQHHLYAPQVQLQQYAAPVQFRQVRVQQVQQYVQPVRVQQFRVQKVQAQYVQPVQVRQLKVQRVQFQQQYAQPVFQQRQGFLRLRGGRQTEIINQRSRSILRVR